MKTHMKRTSILVALCLAIGQTTQCFGLDDSNSDAKGLFRQPDTAGTVGGDEKGLFREPPQVDTSKNDSTKTDAVNIETPQASSVKLEGNIETRFPSPDDVFDIEAEPQPSDTSSKLESIIFKDGDSTFDRYMKKGYDDLVAGALKQSEQNYDLAIKELKKTGKSDLRLAKARNASANVLLRQGKVLDAKTTFELALKTAENNPGNNVEVAKSMAGLAAVNKVNGDFKKAEKLYKEALAIRRKMTGDNDSGMAQMLLDLGEVYRAQKLYSEGEEIFKLALDTLNKSKNVPDLTKAYFLDRTGLFFHDQAKMPEAKKCFAMALEIKDKFTTLYTPVEGHRRGLVYYRCENGVPNAARVFSGGSEIEYLHIKDAVAVATLSAQEYGFDWQLLKAEITIQNQGKKAITACGEAPTFTVELPKRKVFGPLDSESIARQLGIRGRLMFSRLLHSADFAYTSSSVRVANTSTSITPFGAGVMNSVGSWTTVTPDWNARTAARDAAFSSLSRSDAETNSVLSTKPTTTTIGPGESATFQVFFPYEKFDTSVLRFLVGNAVMEFPFTNKSG